MSHIVSIEEEKEVIGELRKENQDLGIMQLKKSFHKFGRKVDEITLKKVVNDARNSDNFGMIIDRHHA